MEYKVGQILVSNKFNYKYIVIHTSNVYANIMDEDGNTILVDNDKLNDEFNVVGQVRGVKTTIKSWFK